jgi:MFS transporter, UMF1 family
MHALTDRIRSFREPGAPGMFNKEVIAWCMYDFGAASFVTSVLTVFFGPFITTVAHNAAASSEFFLVFGVPIAPGAYYPYLISLSVVIQIILLPVLGALADRTRMKKALLTTSAVCGAGSITAMLLVGDSDVLTGGALFLLANICFGASDVLYNAFLPEICPAKNRNSVSSTGWGFGYFGAGVLLLLQYSFLSQADLYHISDLQAARIALASCGIWWGIVAVISLRYFKNRSEKLDRRNKASSSSPGFKQMWESIRSLRRYPQTLLFLVAFLLYSDGIQTLTSVSTQFGQEEIGLTMEQLAEVILIVQFVGVLGAILFNWLAKCFGTKRTIMTALSLYVVIMIYAYGFLHSAFEFYIMAACLALVLVGSQALSRAAFSKMIPPGKEAEYFGIYEISERGTSWLGPLFFGLALQFTGSYRLAILCLIVYFVIGALLLARVKFEKAETDAALV